MYKVTFGTILIVVLGIFIIVDDLRVGRLSYYSIGYMAVAASLLSKFIYSVLKDNNKNKKK